MEKKEFEALWQRYHPAPAPEEVAGPCRFAEQFKQLAHERVMATVRTGEAGRDQVAKAQFILTREFHRMRHSLPAGRHDQGRQRHTCVADVYYELWDQVEAVDALLFDASNLAEPPQPALEPVTIPQPEPPVQHIGGITLGDIVEVEEPEGDAGR